MSILRAAFVPAMLAAIAGLVALGAWQVERLAWKRDRIAQVDRRLAAAPIAAPGPSAWHHATAYTRVTVSGALRNDRETFVQAVTARGPGFWLLTPLETDRGFTVLVNRGFVPLDRHRDPPPTGPVTLSGLLRLTEPNGGFLRGNDPPADRWYSRDVAAIARTRGLSMPAPYFIDADAATSPGSPRGGLTVVRFRNHHLEYALTWFAMAALLAGTLAWLAWRGRRA